MFLIISDTTWQSVQGPDPLAWFSGLTGADRLRSVTLTPRARLWLPELADPGPDSTNALASALTTVFKCQIGPVYGPACVTACSTTGKAGELDPTQATAFSRLLTALSDPTTLTRHRLAGRLAASWHIDHKES